MDFEFTDEQNMFKSSLDRAVREKINPLLESLPEKPLPREACEKIRDILKPFEIHGARIPEELGGSGLGTVGLGIAAESIPYPAFELMMIIELVALRMCLGANKATNDRYLPQLLKAEKFAGSATSEPNVGSNPREIQTSAKLVGDQYVLNGTKIWVSSGLVADLLIIICSVGKDEKGRNIITPFFVDTEESPVIKKETDIMGLRQAHLCELILEDVKIPKENIFGEAEGHAHRMLTTSWLGQRPVFGLCNLRNAKLAYDAALKYSLEREQFGKPVASFQLVQNMLVEMATLIEAGRWLCYRALSMLEKGIRSDKESSMAKFFGCETNLKVCNLAIEIYGSFGITTEYPVEKLYRDARVLAFPDGTNNIQRLIVGRELTGIRAFR